MLLKTRVYLRADGNREIGLGHVHRLIALAETLKKDFDCIFMIRSPLPGIRQLIMECCVSLVEIEQAITLEQEVDELLRNFTGNEIIVLDGYQFDTAYQRKIKKKGSRLVCVDDIHKFHFASDVIINPAGGINQDVYSSDPFTRVYTGPGFAFVKGPFRKTRSGPPHQSRKRLLICMGGADPDNNTLLTLQDTAQSNLESFVVIIGEAYRHKDLLTQWVKRSKKDIQLLDNLTPEKLADTMARCGIAITSASGIAYEYLCIGGELYVKQTALNQQQLYKYLIDSRLAFPYELFPADVEMVKISKAAQEQIFDGASDQRLLKIFTMTELTLKLKMRMAVSSDLLTFFKWANDPEQRQHSYNTNRISLEEHTSWFFAKLADENCILYIFDFNDLPIGQVRLDLKDGYAVISYSIDKEYRGKGFGQAVLLVALKQFIAEHRSSVRILGFVKMNNTSSMRVFEQLGFAKKETAKYPESYCYEYNKL